MKAQLRKGKKSWKKTKEYEGNEMEARGQEKMKKKEKYTKQEKWKLEEQEWNSEGVGKKAKEEGREATRGEGPGRVG